MATAAMTGKSGECPREARKSGRLQTWSQLFNEHIYMILNRVNPGMKLGGDAVQFISKILVLVLHEIVEECPATVTDVQNVIKKLFPSAWAAFVVKHTDISDKTWNKKKDQRSKQSRAIAALYHKLGGILKNQGKVRDIDERVVGYIHLVLEEITYDILKWTSISCNKFLSDKLEIDKRTLVAAIYTDRSLSELMDRILPGTDQNYCIIDYDETTPGMSTAASSASMTSGGEPKTPRQTFYDYNKICREFSHDENNYLLDLSIIVNVFKSRLERGISHDPAGKQYVQAIFGNIHEIYELTLRLIRTIDEVIEMSHTPSMGIELDVFTEGCEFDSYTRFVEIFRNPLGETITGLLRDSRFTRFFDDEDRGCLVAGSQSMRLAYKYVLPMYLHSVAAHFEGYFHYVTLLIKASSPGKDRVELQNLEGHLKKVAADINALELSPNPCKKYSRLKGQKVQHTNHITRVQRSIEGWEGKQIGYLCNRFIREGSINLVHTTVKDHLMGGGKSFTDRYLFLFDYLLVATKKLKSGPNYKYKQQIKVQACDIVDLPDDDVLQNAFKIRIRPENNGNGEETSESVLFCNTRDEKHDWLTAILEVQTAGILHRFLDSYNREQDSKTPMLLPTPDQYRYTEPDTDENINFEDYTRNSGIPVIKNGTLLKLVERLTYPVYVDCDYVTTFFTTYRCFCAPHELLRLLIERFNIPLPSALANMEQTSMTPAASRPGGPLAGRFDTVQSPGLNNTFLEQAYIRFKREFQKPVQMKVFIAINHWVNHHFYDFLNNGPLLQELKEFLEGKDARMRMTNEHVKTCRRLLENISKMEKAASLEEPTATLALVREQNDSDGASRRKNGKVTTMVGNFPEILWHYAKQGDMDGYDLLTLHPIEIGRQVTLLHSHMYSAVRPVELVGAAFMRKNNTDSPQLKKLTHHSNMLTFYIVKTIVETECLDERVELLSRVLEIMSVLEQFNNFSGIVAFTAALMHSAVYRLKVSTGRLDREKRECYDRFKNNFADDPRFKKMRHRLQNINPPCVPFCGTYMNRIYFFEEQNKTFVDKKGEKRKNSTSRKESTTSKVNDGCKIDDSKLISFVKCRKITEIIKEIQLYQSQHYLLRAEPSILQFFENLNPLNGFRDQDELENYLFDQSCKIEPKDQPPLSSAQSKYPSEALRSPGIKVPVTKAAKSVPGKSPKSPSIAGLTPLPPVTPGCFDESNFGILDITPGQMPKYIGDSGRVNQAFTNDTPLPTPKTPRGSRGPASPHSASFDKSMNHFAFPPPVSGPYGFSRTNGTSPSSAGAEARSHAFPTTMAADAIVLGKPPRGRGKPPAPLPTGVTPYSTLKKRPPPPPPCEPSSLHSHRPLPPVPSSTLSAPPSRLSPLHQKNESPTNETFPEPQPPVSPTVSLMVPLPTRRHSSSAGSSSSTDEPDFTSIASAPPRPPKPVVLTRKSPVERSSTSPPPLPPKSYRR